jgi:hypothetical protein
MLNMQVATLKEDTKDYLDTLNRRCAIMLDTIGHWWTSRVLQSAQSALRAGFQGVY